MGLLIRESDVCGKRERFDLAVVAHEMDCARSVLKALIFETTDNLIELHTEYIKFLVEIVEFIVQLSKLNVDVSKLLMEFFFSDE